MSQAIIDKWKDQRGALLMALHEVQRQWGFIPREQAIALAEAMKVPLARIYEVVTFYSYFATSPTGWIKVSVCAGTSCHLKESAALLEAVRAALGIDVGESTVDGMFHLQRVRCVGCCGLGPTLVIGDRTYGKVDPLAVQGIIGEWREGCAKRGVNDGED